MGRNHDRVLKSCSYKVFSPQKYKSKVSHEQAAAAVTIALISEKSKSRENRKQEESVRNLGLKEEKT